MDNTQTTTTTIDEDHVDLSPVGHVSSSIFSLAALPPILVLATHMTVAELEEAEDALLAAHAPLTYAVSEARLFIGKVGQKRRAMLELRAQGLWTEEVVEKHHDEPPRKRRKIARHDSETESESETTEDEEDVRWDFGDCVKVVKLAWLNDCVKHGKLLPLSDYLVYQGRPCEPAVVSQRPSAVPSFTSSFVPRIPQPPSAPPPPPASSTTSQPTYTNPHRTSGPRRPTHLLHETTSEHDGTTSSTIPTPPPWALDTRTHAYSCCRATPASPPNAPFIAALTAIRLARTLTDDQIGVRAYSTAIASIAAYPHSLTSPRELLSLPGCDAKIATLFAEWATTGALAAADELASDPRLRVLEQFYNIWGVGPHTAREFHDVRGWRDLDDVVEYGWGELSRVQQIGLKYYDELALGIPRAEVERIGKVVHEHAQRCCASHPGGVRSCIVGGYRRGKALSGDVDVVVSHVDEACTLGLVAEVVRSLVGEGWVTHELVTSLQGTQRGQAPLPFRGAPSGHGLRGGFDTLDKSMVVWQDIHWEGGGPERSEGTEGSKTQKNPNPHRRVDIIVAPFSQAGCAVMGWSGGTTFQRDLRRWSTNVKGWKFDSSGVRDRGSGEVIDFGALAAAAKKEGEAECGAGLLTLEEKEREVFEGLGLVFREPWERCTG